MKGNITNDSYQGVDRRNIAVSSQDNDNKVDMEYTEPEDADIKELNQGEDSTDTDDPKRGACSQSNESCRKSTVGVAELKHDDKGNINLP